MKTKIKNFLKTIIGPNKFFNYRYAKFIYDKNFKDKNKVFGMIKSLSKTKVYYDKSKGIEFDKLLKNVDIISVLNDRRFYYYVDFFKTTYSSNLVISNISIDYSIILDNSLSDLKNKIDNSNKEFYDNEIKTIEAIESYIDKITNKLKNDKNNTEIINNLSSIKDAKAKSLHDALQRILFFNMLLWQTNHKLNGFGRLDIILMKYYKKDLENGIFTENELKELLREFLLTIHEFYKMKSNALLGDTGQIIELGGENINGEYLCNELTYLFIELMEELKLPDPKVLVRVSKKTPRSLIEKSLKCIQTGIGCPLFANDDIIIDKLLKFGYDKEDVYNYGTSACWEPYLIGKSSAQNNINSISYMIPLNELLENENLNGIKDIDELLVTYKKYLKIYLDNLIDIVNETRYEKDPLVSLFINDCIKNSKDISEGGAKYNDSGLTSVGLANLVNSICNVDEIIFKNKEMTLAEFNEIRKQNFINKDELVKRLKNIKDKYGKDDEKVLNITNDLIQYTTELLKDKRNYLGGKYKFGLSAPSYIELSKSFPASFDGRKDREPFAVHISSDSSNAYTELMQFASKIDYNENRFNGNVVDFFVSPNFISDNFDKFVDFLLLSIKLGFFEMQMNIVSSKQLIEARENPEKFPNLVVRVWGFSAYFNDLPDEYKDYLIERAIQSESNSK